MTARKRNLGLGWLTKKRVTYRRRVGKERQELKRQAFEERKERIALKKLEAEERTADARIAAATRKIETAGKKADAGGMAESRFEAMKARMESEIAKQEEYKAAARARAGNPCARTRKSTVTDRAKRYRANQRGCKPRGVKRCKLCRSRRFVTVDHADGNESNGAKSNLRWLCKSCNTMIGAEMARKGIGRRTEQYNPGAETSAQYARAVSIHESHYVPGKGRVGAHDEGGAIIHDTPKSKRREFASDIWASRKAHGNPEQSTEYQLGYSLGQRDRETASLRRTPGELEATFRAKFDPARASTLMFAEGYEAGYGSAALNARRRNPEPDEDEKEQARKIAALFHGRPVKEEITVTEQIREHDWLWRIGPLVKLKVKTIRKQRATFPFSLKGDALVHLMCSPDGRQLYLRDGDMQLDLEPLGMDGDDWKRDKMVIGEITEITYQDRKKFHSFDPVQYWHKLGEETKVKPWLIYDTLNDKLEIVGGQYYVETKQLIEEMSPGLVN